MFANTVNEIKEHLSGLLNESVFTLDSIEGVIVIILCVLIIYEASRKAIQIAEWLFAVIFLFQVCYWLGYTSLNDIIPFNKVFKYDVITAVAQCFVGTKFCDGLLWFNAFIRALCVRVWTVIDHYLPYVHIKLSDNIYDHLKN